MIYWLLVFVTLPNGEVERVSETMYTSKQECQAHLPKRKRYAVCVSNDHYTGISVDPDVPLDF